MEIALLAKNLTLILSPFLPYLLKAGEKTAENIGSKFAEGGWERAQKLWAKLQPKLTAKPAAQEAVQDVANAPEDEDAQAALRQQLKKLLSEDAALATELVEIIQPDQPTTDAVNVNQQAGDNAIMFGQVGEAGNINIQR